MATPTFADAGPLNASAVTSVAAPSRYTYTAAGAQTFVLYTKDCTVEIYREIEAGWEDHQGTIGTTRRDTTFNSLASDTSVWILQCTPHLTRDNPDPKIFLEVR